jgi:hypothetical protein
MPRISNLGTFDLGDLARRLVRVASPSMFIAAAACGGTTSAANSQPVEGTGGAQADGSPGTGASPSTGGAPQELPVLVTLDGGYPHCTGMTTTFTGPCCVSVHCVEPPGGGALCPAASAVTEQDLGYAGLGSGQCRCVPIDGPFAVSSAGQYSATEGPCCYTIGVMGCTGRPLMVAGRPRLAPLVRRGGWA